MNELIKYIGLFENMKMNKHGDELAPHKPLLMLVIIDMIEDGHLNSNIVMTSEELESRFVAKWNKYVGNDTNYLPNVWMPYFHLRSESFWDLNSKIEGFNMEKVTKNTLDKYYYPAAIKEDLYYFLCNRENRDILRHVLRSLLLH